MSVRDPNGQSGACAVDAIRRPVSIYILWHPRCEDGPDLAETVYQWFAAPSTDVLQAGLGLPVHYRTSVETPILYCEAQDNVLVVLIDEHMVNDASWRRAVYEHARRARAKPKRGSVHLVPVALHPGAFQLTGEIERLNFVRLEERGDPEYERDEHRRARRAGRLRRRLTEILARRLRDHLSEGTPHKVPDEVTVFISHAKADGAAIGESLRDAIIRYGQLQPWYDENDLAYGYDWADELERHAQQGTAAMLAVVTDRYASRPWCRREISLARRPRQLPYEPSVRVVQPVIAIDALGGAFERGGSVEREGEPSPYYEFADPFGQSFTRRIPELGCVPTIRWHPSQISLILDRLLLESVLSYFHALFASQLHDRYRRAQPDKQRVFITWVPDPFTLLQLDGSQSVGRCEIVYPGHGLLAAEVARLERYFRDHEFRSFEEYGRKRPDLEGKLGGLVVGLSIGNSDDASALGYGPEHLDAAVLRIARQLFLCGARIVYGGVLFSDERRTRFTELLIDLAAMYRGRRNESKRSVLDELDELVQPHTPLVNYQAWPWCCERLTSSLRASLHGVCEFVSVLPQGGVPEPPLDEAERRWIRAATLTRMREWIAGIGRRESGHEAARSHEERDETASEVARTVPHVRVVLGGRLFGWTGILPGTLEDVVLAAKMDVPVFVIGGLGGCAKVIAEYLCGSSESLPDELTMAYHEDRAQPFRELCRSARAETAGPGGASPRLVQIRDAWAEASEWLPKLRARIHHEDAAKRPGGLSPDDARALMTTTSIYRINELLARALGTCLDAAARATEESVR